MTRPRRTGPRSCVGRAARLSQLRCRALLLASLAVAGCDRPPPVAPAPAPVAPPPAPPPRIDTPLPLPDHAVLVGRWQKPTALLRQLQTWAGGDLSLELLLRGRIARPSRPVDLDAPLEFFALWDGNVSEPGLHWALSLPLVAGSTPAEGTPASGKPSSPAAPRDVPSPLGLSCAEAPALGAVALRLVCTSSDGDLAQLLPIATRALPLAELGGGDLSLRLHARPLRAIEDGALRARASYWLSSAFGLSLLNRKGEAELASLAQLLSDELRNLADDFDGTTLELWLRGTEQRVDVSLVAPRAAVRSELLQLLLGTGAAGIAPNDFWQLRYESDRAAYLWGFNAVPLARLRAPLGSLLGALLDFRGLPDRLTAQGRRIVERVPLPQSPIVLASGRLPPRREGRGPAPVPWLSDLGWGAYTFAGNFAEYEAWAEQLAAAFDDPVLRSQLSRLLRSAVGERWVPRRIQRRAPNHARGLPHDSFTLELSFDEPLPEPEQSAAEPGLVPASQRSPTPVVATQKRVSSPTLFVLCVPEPDGVKLAWGADEQFLARVVAPVTPKTAPSTLAARAGLGALNQQRTLAGGFSSLAALSSGSSPGLPGLALLPTFALLLGVGELPLGAPVLQAVEGAPHRGQSPILYQLSRGEQQTALTFNASLGRDTWEDLLFLIAKPPP
ncbi:MAG: hypothetical protein RL033_6397 [Pseudomonadota bacterium]